MNAPLKPKMIVWVVMDTLRADHLGLYGYPRPTSPFMDELAKEAVVFDWAFSTCPYSNPSHASMLTGRYPSNHYQGFSNGPPQNQPPPGEKMPVEELLFAGYTTASFFPKRTPVHFTGSNNNFGFKERFQARSRSESQELIDSLATFLGSGQDSDCFVFINFFDIHGPYLHQEPYRSLFTSDPWSIPPLHFRHISPNTDPRGGIPEYQLLEKREESGLLREFRTDLRYYMAQYDAGIRKADQSLGQLVELVKKTGRYDDTLLIVSADHGEAFGENDIFGTHGFTLTPDQIHVPLLLKPHRGWPVKAGRIGTQVSLVDVVPTILELAGIKHKGRPFDGRSLVDLVQGQTNKLEERKIQAETCFQTCCLDRENLSIRPRTEEGISALRPREQNFPGSLPMPMTGDLFKQSMSLKYRLGSPSPLAAPSARLFFQPLPWMDKQKLDLTLTGIRKAAVAEFLFSTGALVSTLDHLVGELNRLGGELHSIPAPIRRLVRLLRSWPWLRRTVGRLRKMGRSSTEARQ